ncbi:MAG TPA: hypothetical protein VN633_15825 [Bryobacteraceae bacterium]|nr:hypothetical protein [Bryobacteraceae bacterium]
MSQSDEKQSMCSEARRRANRLNAKSSSGPKSPEGKKRSCLNATRHGILSQTIHFPEEEMKAYTEFCERYVAGLQPVGALETELAKACADLQFRLHRCSAAEHNMFAIGFEENGNCWETGHPESHSALALAETLRSNPNPIATLSLYEQRINRRFLQTLKQLREIQAERRQLEQTQLKELCLIAASHPEETENITPERFGFVCSSRDWAFYRDRFHLMNPVAHASACRGELKLTT